MNKYRINDFWLPDYVSTPDRESVIKTTLRKLIIFVAFLTTATIMAFGIVPPLQYVFTKVIQNQFLNVEFPTASESLVQFNQIQSAADFWRYMHLVVMNNLYWDYWYSYEDPIAPTSNDDRKILYENQLLGAPRLRQLRVRNDSCKVHPNFRGMIESCYAEYSQSAKDTLSFGVGSGTAWTYSSHKKLEGSYYFGQVGIYDGGGYYVDFSLLREQSKTILKELKTYQWITRHTRAVFLDFTLYNANLNLFSVIKLVFEFPPTGGVLPSSSFHTVKLIRYFSKTDYAILAFELIFLCFILYYTIEEILELKHYKLKYFTKFWNYIDLIIILSAHVCIAFSIYRTLVVRSRLQDIKNDPNKYLSFEFVGFWQSQFNNVVAITLFIIWIKLFKYVNISHTMGQLSITLSMCAKEILGFSLMFFIVFFAFAQVGYLVFGSQIERFSSFGNSVLSLLMTILGEFDYDEIEKTSKVMAPIFFATYIFFVFFVLFNMFLAIITDTYSEVKSEIAARKDETEIIDVLKRGPRSWFKKCGLRVFPKPESMAGNEVIKNLRKILQLCKFTDAQINVLFAKYNIHENDQIGEYELRVFLSALKGDKEQKDPGRKVNKASITVQQYINQQVKLDQIEHDVKSIRQKIDVMIRKKEESSKKREIKKRSQ